MSRPRADLVALMADAVDFSVRHVESGGIPFVGLVADDNGYVSKYGVNQVLQTGDPTAHAEIQAMRQVMGERRLDSLKGFSLLATGEPCGLCYRFAEQHQIDAIYVAVDADTVAEWGFDYRGSYPALGIDRAQLDGYVWALRVDRALEPFERYLHRNDAGGPIASSRSARHINAHR